jgi:hypothetical protein
MADEYTPLYRSYNGLDWSHARRIIRPATRTVIFHSDHFRYIDSFTMYEPSLVLSLIANNP